jgi:hypothetical protein
MGVAGLGFEDGLLGGHGADQGLSHGQPDFAHREHSRFVSFRNEVFASFFKKKRFLPVLF